MIRIERNSKVVKGVVSLPPSKSITNRALVIRSFVQEKFEIINSSNSEDSKTLSAILENLSPEIDAGNGGTTFRFLTSLLSVRPGEFVLSGSPRMNERPVGELVNALKTLGADIEYKNKENFPPLKIKGVNFKGGTIKVDASESSQFISALLLIAPLLSGGLKVEMKGKVFSRPYISMTLSVLKHFGIESHVSDDSIIIEQQKLIPRKIEIENDWSSASFWYLIAALADEAEITMKEISKTSIQGDRVIDTIMKNFGVESKEVGKDIIISKNKNFVLPDYFEYDFSGCPDLVIPVSVACAGLKIPARFTGVKNLKIKESDRLRAIKEEFEKIGIEVETSDDTLIIKSFSGKVFNKLFHSHGDHRMVMSLAALSMIYHTVVIDNHTDVRKSYPAFWEQMKAAGFSCDLI